MMRLFLLKQLVFETLTKALEVVEKAIALGVELLLTIDFHDVTVGCVVELDITAWVRTLHELEVDLEDFACGQVFTVFGM